jgi:hypothetical protein
MEMTTNFKIAHEPPCASSRYPGRSFPSWRTHIHKFSANATIFAHTLRIPALAHGLHRLGQGSAPLSAILTVMPVMVCRMFVICINVD